MHKTVVGQININSIRNKFDPLMAGNIDTLLITETPHFSKTNFMLIAVTYPTDMTVTLTVMAFWSMLAMILGHALPSSFEGLVIELSFNLKKMTTNLLLQSS